MTRTARTAHRTTVLLAASMLALAGVASAVGPAHAATPPTTHQVSAAVTPRPTTMYIYNHSNQTLVSVAARIEPCTRRHWSRARYGNRRRPSRR